MFSERDIQDIQDQLNIKAVQSAERAERRYLENTKILLTRCTMCSNLERKFLEPEEPRDIEQIIRDAFAEPEIHYCDESAGAHRKYGVKIPIGVLSKW